MLRDQANVLAAHLQHDASLYIVVAEKEEAQGSLRHVANASGQLANPRRAHCRYTEPQLFAAQRSGPKF